MLNNLGDGSTLTLDFTTGVLDSRLTFSRSTGGSYVHSDGLLYGFDTSSSSNTIGTGSKTFTISATAGVNRRYAVGDLIIASSGANNMSGSVTSYDPATQALVCNMASSTGSGTFTTWIIGNRQPRFDHDPTTLAPRGLLIEGQAVNLLCWSESFATSGGTTNWTYNGNSGATVTETNPAGGSSSFQFRETSGSGPLSQTVTTVSTSPYTFSFWVRASVFNSVTTTQIQVGIFTTAFQTVSISKISGPGSVSGTGLCTVSGLSLTEWTKVQVTTTGNIGATSASVMLYAQTASFELDRSLLIWGAMLEQGSGASSYIPTGASTATRNPDNVVTAIANVTGFNANQGTMFQSWQDSTAQDTTTVQEWAFAFGLTSAAGFGIYVSNAVSGTFGIFAGSSNTGDAGAAGTYVINGINKTALAINVTTAPNTGTISLSANGSAAVSGTRLDGYNQAQTLSLGQRNSNQRYLNGWIRQFKYWPYVLPNAQLQSLTT
jgi:hypothetical protein